MALWNTEIKGAYISDFFQRKRSPLLENAIAFANETDSVGDLFGGAKSVYQTSFVKYAMLPHMENYLKSFYTDVYMGIIARGRRLMGQALGDEG